MTGGHLTQDARGAYVNLEAQRWAETIKGLSIGPNALLHLLARRSDDFGCSFYKQRSMAKDIGCSSRSVQTYIRALEAFGLVRTIGRRDNLRQLTNVYHLIGWTGAKTIPPAGHPKLGRWIKAPADIDQLDTIRRQNLRMGGENSANHNIVIENNTTSAAENYLEHCIDALGSWVGDREMGLLREDQQTLSRLIELGYCVEVDVLPVLRRKAQGPKPCSVIRSWSYFSNAIADHVRRTVEGKYERAEQPHQPEMNEAQPMQRPDQARITQDLIRNVVRRPKPARVLAQEVKSRNQQDELQKALEMLMTSRQERGGSQ